MTINKHATKHNAQLLDAIHSTNMCPSNVSQDKQTKNTLREYINPSNSPLHFLLRKSCPLSKAYLRSHLAVDHICHTLYIRNRFNLEERSEREEAANN